LVHHRKAIKTARIALQMQSEMVTQDLEIIIFLL
jgi:hypothetical protein